MVTSCLRSYLPLPSVPAVHPASLETRKTSSSQLLGFHLGSCARCSASGRGEGAAAQLPDFFDVSEVRAEEHQPKLSETAIRVGDPNGKREGWSLSIEPELVPSSATHLFSLCRSTQILGKGEVFFNQGCLPLFLIASGAISGYCHLC